jgi:hypothetical protein
MVGTEAHVDMMMVMMMMMLLGQTLVQAEGFVMLLNGAAYPRDN